MLPTVTIAIPVYNRRELTLLAVRSALEQDIEGLEVLAVDDCSTDDVWGALNEVRDPRLRLVRNPVNLGLFGNFNRCLELARGKYLRLLCCDDRLLPGCLRTEVGLLDARPDASIVSTRGRLVRPDGSLCLIFARHLRAGFYSGPLAVRACLWVNAFHGFNPFNYPSGVLMRRETVNRVGPFDTRLKVAGDVDLFLRILYHGGLIVADHFGCEILHHEGQMNRKLMQEGHHLRELVHLTRTHSTAVRSPRERAELLRQLAGQALGWELIYRRQRNHTAAEAYALIRRELGAGVVAPATGLSVLAAHRLHEKLVGRPRVPFCPEPLTPVPGTRQGFPQRTAPR
jgi:glycosyltransferase involved in cell wall biosynthesis